MGTLTKPLLFSAPAENVNSLHKRIFYACQTIRGRPRLLRNSAMDHDKTWPCANWFKVRTFWTFVLNCDLTSNKKLTMPLFYVRCQVGPLWVPHISVYSLSHIVSSATARQLHAVIYKYAVVLLHVSAFVGHLQGGTWQRKIQQRLIMSHVEQS